MKILPALLLASLALAACGDKTEPKPDPAKAAPSGEAAKPASSAGAPAAAPAEKGGGW